MANEILEKAKEISIQLENLEYEKQKAVISILQVLVDAGSIHHLVYTESGELVQASYK